MCAYDENKGTATDEACGGRKRILMMMMIVDESGISRYNCDETRMLTLRYCPVSPEMKRNMSQL